MRDADEGENKAGIEFEQRLFSIHFSHHRSHCLIPEQILLFDHPPPRRELVRKFLASYHPRKQWIAVGFCALRPTWEIRYVHFTKSLSKGCMRERLQKGQ
jgi:hypothetical protein